MVLITLNTLGRQIVPEVHFNNRLNAVYIYCRKDNERIKWARCYDKVKGSTETCYLTTHRKFQIKLITTDETDLINGIRNEGLCHSTVRILASFVLKKTSDQHFLVTLASGLPKES